MAKLLSPSSWLPIPKRHWRVQYEYTYRGQLRVQCSDEEKENKKKEKRLSEQSSWEAKDVDGRDYLYRLGKEADNMNIAVGQRAGIIDPLFAGNFLGKDCIYFFIIFDFFSSFSISLTQHVLTMFFVLSCVVADIVFDYRQKATRSFEYLQGDYYIAPLFMVTNFLLP